jgi:hypothetical protein
MSLDSDWLRERVNELLEEFACSDDTLTVVDDWVLVASMSDVEHREQGSIGVVYPLNQWPYRTQGLLDHAHSELVSTEE